jgi:hypothetical protein
LLRQNAATMLVGATVAGMVGGDPARFVSIAALTAILVALTSQYEEALEELITTALDAKQLGS